MKKENERWGGEESCDFEVAEKKKKKKKKKKKRPSSSLSLAAFSLSLSQPFFQMGKLKSVLPVAQAVHRLCRLGGMPEPRWLAAAERCGGRIC